MYVFFMYTLYLFAHDRFEKPVVKKSNSKQFDIANVDVLETEEWVIVLSRQCYIVLALISRPYTFVTAMVLRHAHMHKPYYLTITCNIYMHQAWGLKLTTCKWALLRVVFTIGDVYVCLYHSQRSEQWVRETQYATDENAHKIGWKVQFRKLYMCITYTKICQVLIFSEGRRHVDTSEEHYCTSEKGTHLGEIIVHNNCLCFL